MSVRIRSAPGDSSPPPTKEKDAYRVLNKRIVNTIEVRKGRAENLGRA